MAHYTLIARINAGNGRFPFVNVQFTKTHRPIPIAEATYYLRRSGGARTPIRIGKDLAAAHAALLHMGDREVREVTLRSPSNKPVSSQRKTVADEAREYLERSKQKSRKTYIGYRTAVNLFVQSCKKTYLEIGLDKLLREKRRYQGDLSASINDALLAVNLNTVKLVTLQGKKKQTARETQVVLRQRLIRKLHHVAEARGCSINQLVNSGLAAYYSKEQREKRGASSRPTRPAARAIYDKMSPEERQQLVEALAGLEGLQEGPKDAFPDGTRYEYESRLKTTFEITPSGKRFPVELVAGKFRRRPAKPEAHKTLR